MGSEHKPRLEESLRWPPGSVDRILDPSVRPRVGDQPPADAPATPYAGAVRAARRPLMGPVLRVIAAAMNRYRAWIDR